MTEQEKQDVASDLQHDLRRILYAVFAVALVLAGAIVWAYIDSQSQRNGLRQDARSIKAEQEATADRERRTAAHERKNRAVFCAIHDNLVTRVASDKIRVAQGRAFLRSHPNGIAGFSRRLLLTSVKQQEGDYADELAFLTALRPLGCPPPKARSKTPPP